MAEHASRPAGVNGPFFVSGLTGLAAYYFWPGDGAYIQQHIAAWSLSTVSLASLVAGAKALASDIGIRKKLIDAQKPSTEHGSAREATEKELEERGVFDPGSGTFLGFVFGRAAFVPSDVPFSLIEAPPGSGKDTCIVTGDVIHHSLLGYSVLVVDIKPETGPMLTEGLCEAGVEVWNINPAHKYLEKCGNVELGLYQAIIDAVHGDENARKDAVGIAQNVAKLHLPDSEIDKGKLYFVGGTRRSIVIVILTLAIIDPANCHPGRVFETLNDTKRFIRFLKAIVSELKPIGTDEQLVAFVKSEAQNLISRSETNAENFGAFLEWATQVLAPFNQAGYLASYGEKATQDVKSLRERPITTFVMTPHSHKEEFKAFTSITNDNLLSACKRHPTGQKLHAVFNEALNYDFSNLAGDLEVMRGMKMTANIYIQSYNGLVRKMGKDAAAAVNDYCDCKVYFGINSYDRAKALSDILSATTINSMDYSHKTTPDDLNISHKRHARPLRTPDEILAAPRDEAWVLLKGVHPFRAKLAHYGHVDPWNKIVGASPMEGEPLKGKTLLKINYPERT